MTVSNFKSAEDFKAQLFAAAQALKQGKTINGKLQVNSGFFYGLKVVVLKIVTLGFYSTHMRADQIAQTLLKESARYMSKLDQTDFAKMSTIFKVVNKETGYSYSKNLNEAQFGINVHRNMYKKAMDEKFDKNGILKKKTQEPSILGEVVDKIKNLGNGILNFFRQEQETN